MMAEGPIVLAAGGTGGHLSPAQALAEALVEGGHDVHLLTDTRGLSWADSPVWTVHCLSSAPLSKGGVFGRVRGVWAVLRGVWEAFRLMRTLRPRCVVGFGGYPSVPPLIAAGLLKIPTFIHEQNATLGKANWLCGYWAKGIAHAFPVLEDLPDRWRKKTVHTGNPVRAHVLRHRPLGVRSFAKGEKFRLVVVGGSQGAAIFSDLIPQALAFLSPGYRCRLCLVQQCRKEDVPRVDRAYQDLGIEARLAPFFNDIAPILSGADLVVSRAGASILSELSVLACPAFLVPLPKARDQARNAAALAARGGALWEEQGALTPGHLCEIIQNLMENPERLGTLSRAISQNAILKAAEALKEMVLRR